jgi:methionine synthase II (cobalamin-independent)
MEDKQLRKALRNAEIIGTEYLDGTGTIYWTARIPHLDSTNSRIDRILEYFHLKEVVVPPSCGFVKLQKKSKV